MSKKDALNYYEKELAPLIFTLKNKCRRAKMPMFIGICVDPGKVVDDSTVMVQTKDPEYKFDMVTPYYCNCKTEPDVIAECIKVANGFHAVPIVGTIEDTDYSFLHVDEDEKETEENIEE